MFFENFLFNILIFSSFSLVLFREYKYTTKLLFSLLCQPFICFNSSILILNLIITLDEFQLMKNIKNSFSIFNFISVFLVIMLFVMISFLFACFLKDITQFETRLNYVLIQCVATITYTFTHNFINISISLWLDFKEDNRYFQAYIIKYLVIHSFLFLLKFYIILLPAREEKIKKLICISLFIMEIINFVLEIVFICKVEESLKDKFKLQKIFNKN